MDLAKSETIVIGGHDLRHLGEYLRSLPTLTADEAKQAVTEMTRKFREAWASAKPKAQRERVPLEQPTGLNRAQRRAWAKKNR